MVIGFNSVFCLVIVVISLVHRFQSGRFDPSYRSTKIQYAGYGVGDDYDKGVFDLGSWTCALSAYHAFDDSDHVMRRQCVGETGALWSSVLLVLSNLVLSCSIWADWRGQRALVRDYKDAFPDEYECDHF